MISYIDRNDKHRGCRIITDQCLNKTGTSIILQIAVLNIYSMNIPYKNHKIFIGRRIDCYKFRVLYI